LTQIFFTFLGEYATVVINFYRENQSWLNIVVLAYGILLAMAHRNVVRLEQQLKDDYKEDDLYQIRLQIESDGIEIEDMERLKKNLRIPILASPYHFFFYRVSTNSILRILRKKYPRSK
jgi:hypothetical protein